MLQLNLFIFLVVIINAVESFRNFGGKFQQKYTILSSSTSTSTESWQEDIDRILDVDVPCESKQKYAQNIISKIGDVSNDIQQAVKERDIEKVAPKNFKYGRAVKGLRAFQQQLLTDIIPDFLTKGVPKLVEEAPQLLNQIAEGGPEGIVGQGQKVVERITEISEDASALQATLDDLKTELKNIVRSTPEGLTLPSYEVLETTDDYEIRKYAEYSVCSTSVESDEYMMDPISTAKSFNTLAAYIFGENDDEQEMSMTAPVIMEGEDMYFVLPDSNTADTAPLPKSNSISLKDIAEDFVAVREFTGLATETEVNKQKSLLEDALISSGVEYDSLTFRVFQYNPPYTLPWVRRNEVVFSVKEPKKDILISDTKEESTDSNDTPDDVDGDDSSTYFSAPEAGD